MDFSFVAPVFFLGIVCAILRLGNKAYARDHSPLLRLFLFGVAGHAIAAFLLRKDWELFRGGIEILSTALCARALMHAGKNQRGVTRTGILASLFIAVGLPMASGLTFETAPDLARSLQLLACVASALLIGTSLGHVIFGQDRNWRWLAAGWLVAYGHLLVATPSRALFFPIGFLFIGEGLRRWAPTVHATENVRNASYALKNNSTAQIPRITF